MLRVGEPGSVDGRWSAQFEHTVMVGKRAALRIRAA
jgi:hypothetical protein